MRAMAARLDESMPVGNEGAGVVVGRAHPPRPGPAGQDRRHPRRRHVRPVPRTVTAAGLPAAAGRRDAGRRRLVLRQSADRARHGRDHAARGPHRAGAHRRRLEPGPDAEQDLPQGRRRPGQHRAQRRAGRRSCASIGAKHVANSSPTFMDDLIDGARRRPARRSPSTPSAAASWPGQILTGMEAAASRPRRRLQPLRLHRAQAGLHLRRARYAPRPSSPRLRHGLGRRRLAADAVPAEDRAAEGAEAAPARGRRTEDHLRQPLHRR